ncbi:MAG TPA: chemotaxis protein CheW [Polyangiaceae bacterium]|jgi:hypothetical protein
MTAAKRGGVVVRHRGALRFLPASLVVRIAQCPPVSRVPGAPEPMLGIAYEGGEIVPVVGLDDVDAAHGELIVCRYLGEPVGIVGCEVVETGLFEPDPSTEGAVAFRGEPARTLDLASTFAKLSGARAPLAT